MSDEVDFPVYVLARDCGEVTAYPSLEVMKGYFEAIDVEKNEYEAWDANGFPVMLTVLDVNSGWLKITKNSDSAIVEEKLMELKAIAKQYRGPQGLLRSLKNRLHGR